jgi:hypothetical protein
MKPMAAIRATAAGKTVAGLSPRADTAAGSGKTPPLTIDLTSEVVRFGMEAFAFVSGLTSEVVRFGMEAFVFVSGLLKARHLGNERAAHGARNQ